jgi:1-pyrroline-5-carboxylate dehydrogenase
MSDFKLTYATMFNPPEELHTRFDAALAAVRANLGQEYGMLINGAEAFAGTKFKSTNPSNTEEVLGYFQTGTAEDANTAIAAARAAFPGWSHTPYQERVALLRKAAALIDARIFKIGAAISLEVGKNRMEALGDIAETADLIRYSCYQMEKNEGFVVEMGRDPLVGYASTNTSVLRPYGVWLVISPFNFPAALSGGPVGAALVAGNTVVLKPATDTPWSVRLLSECFHEAGLPAGVFNFITGPGRTLGQALIDNPSYDLRIGRQESYGCLPQCGCGARRYWDRAFGFWVTGSKMFSLLPRLHRGAALRRIGSPYRRIDRETCDW